MRTAWKGRINLSGGNVGGAVKAYAVHRSSTISFVSVHAECPCEGEHKLQHHKFCPACSTYPRKEEIGKAYDYGGGLVRIQESDIEKCKANDAVGMEITGFIKRQYFNLAFGERSYYIVPEDGHTGFIDAFAHSLSNRIGVGILTLQGRKRPAMIEATQADALMIHLLHETSSLRTPDDITDRKRVHSSSNVALLRRIAKAMEIDPADWKPEADPYRESLSETIQGLVKAHSSSSQSSAPAPTKEESLEEQLKASLALLK